jgi:phospholipid-binding lipoprotein MlaA
MKTSRYIVIVFVVFILSSFFAVSTNMAAQKKYPDLLSDDVREIDDSDESVDIVINDPLEPMNRAFFQFNDVFYEWLLKPVTDGYMWVFPLELRESFGNFFLNLATPVRLLNSLLQGDLEKTGVVMKRFLINSTLGVYGFADIADVEFGIEPKYADFGQTLGKWGLGEGIYFCWPVVGPSNVRDSVGLAADSYSHPIPYLYDNFTLNASYYSANKVNNLSLHPNAYEDLKRYSVDPYAASRQAYYEYRQAVISNK